MKKQSGFAAFEIVLVAAVLALIAFTAYTYTHHDQVVQQTSDASDATSAIPTAPEITTAADLTKAEAALDQTDLSASDNDDSRLNSELANF